jgi:hypothetical protein
MLRRSLFGGGVARTAPKDEAGVSAVVIHRHFDAWFSSPAGKLGTVNQKYRQYFPLAQSTSSISFKSEVPKQQWRSRSAQALPK